VSIRILNSVVAISAIFAFSANAKIGNAVDTTAPIHAGSQQGQAKKNESFEQLRADYQAVVSGGLPKYATKQDGEMADGGTTFYKGKGYSLMIQSSMGKLGDINGYFYGPVITPEGTQASMNPEKISHIEFYSLDEFKRIKGK
jgi:hypothetical protein